MGVTLLMDIKVNARYSCLNLKTALYYISNDEFSDLFNHISSFVKKQNHLFQLVKSLSASEKRYFALFALRNGKRGSKLYSQLFSVIESQDDYNEERIKEEFAGTSFGKSLAFPKSHLYQQVLRALQSYQYEKTPLNRSTSCLEKIALLSDRGFPKQALKTLEKGLKIALGLDQAMQVLQLLRWKRRLILRNQAPNYPQEIAQISEQEAFWESLMGLEQRAIRLHDTLYMAMQEARRKTMVHPPQNMLALKMEIEALMEESRMTFEARLALFRAKAHHAHLMDDFAGVHAANQDEVETWQAHPEQLKQDGMRFVRSFGAWLNSKTLIGDYGNLLTEIRHLRAQEGMDMREQALIFRITYSLELFYYLNAAKWSEALDLAPAIAQGLESFASHLSPGFKLGFYHNLAVMYWLGGRPEEAMKWTCKILHFESGAIRKDIREFAPLLEKILFFECGYTDLLESWFRSVRYRKGKGNIPSTLELMLFKLIHNLVDVLGSSTSQSFYRDFLAELKDYAASPSISKLGLEEVRIWATDKLSPEL